MEQRNLRIAVSKGSLFGDAVELLTEAGLDTTGLADPGRRLIISNPGVDFIIVRPTDAPMSSCRSASIEMVQSQRSFAVIRPASKAF